MTQTQTLYADLVWQVEAGADEAIEDQAGFLHWKSAAPRQSPVFSQASVSRPVFDSPLAQEGALPYIKTTPAPVPIKAAMPFPAPVPVTASSLAELKTALEAFDGCELKQTAMNLVFADGNPEADIMIVGDVPAEDEDRQGLPFAGANGQLLDKMLAAIGLDRDKVYMTNLVFWRPPGNRTPSEVELAACLPFTQQHIRLKAPKLIILFGALTAKTLLRTKEPFSKLRGRWADYTITTVEGDGQTIPCLPMYHPAYLMRQPSAKRLAWADLLNFKEKLTTLSC